MILYAVLLTGQKITLTVPATDTIRSVKQKIEEREGIPTNTQRLVYLTKELSNDDTLDDYGFQNEGVMYMCMNLFVTITSGKTITLRAFGIDTIEDIKKKILDREGIPVDEQRLVYVDKELHEDHKTLIDYKVQNNGKMYMTMRLKGGLVSRLIKYRKYITFTIKNFKHIVMISYIFLLRPDKNSFIHLSLANCDYHSRKKLFMLITAIFKGINAMTNAANEMVDPGMLLLRNSYVIKTIALLTGLFNLTRSKTRQYIN